MAVGSIDPECLSMCLLLFRRLYTLMPYRYDWKSVARDRPMAYIYIYIYIYTKTLGMPQGLSTGGGG